MFWTVFGRKATASVNILALAPTQSPTPQVSINGSSLINRFAFILLSHSFFSLDAVLQQFSAEAARAGLNYKQHASVGLDLRVV